MISSPSARGAPARASDRYIHTFGFELARTVLGAGRVNECLRRAYREQLLDPSRKQLDCFRAGWRSSVRHPWNLSKVGESLKADGDGGDDDDGGKRGDMITPEALFVDVTFDFLLFPAEVVAEGRTHRCHVLRREDFWGGDDDDKDEGASKKSDGGYVPGREIDSIALSVAVRVGALVAVPSHRLDGDNATTVPCGNGMGKDGAGDSGNDAGYQYFYVRGDDALTTQDLEEHCRGVDIVLEEMAAADVAGLVGGAFLGTNSWQVEAKRVDGVTAAPKRTDTAEMTTIESLGKPGRIGKKFHWYVKLHHGSLESDGILPLSSYGGMGEPIGRCILDMILLQSSNDDNSRGGAPISVPKAEALALWKIVDPSIVRALEKPVEPSPQKMSPARDIALAAATAPAAQKEEKDDAKSKPKPVARRPPRPQETALFARGKKTTLGGSRRKKPKFTLGPA